LRTSKRGELDLIPMKPGRVFETLACALLSLAFLCFRSSAQMTPTTHELALRIIVAADESTASDILERLAKGEDFGALAKQKSIDPTGQAGGYTGLVDPSSLLPELREALQGLVTGQLSKIVHIPEGYAILEIVPSSQAAASENAARNQPAALSALQGPGAIRFTPDVSGIIETQSALVKSAKPPGWGQDLKEVCQTRTDTYRNAIKRMESMLSPSSSAQLSGQDSLDLTQEYYGLGQLYAYAGKMDEAIGEYLKGYEIAKDLSPDVVPTFDQELGVAYLHQSEMKNGIYDAPGDRCLIPPPANMSFQKKEDSLKAIEYFQKYLEKAPNDLAIRWLLNYAYMTIGRYPEGVPKQFLIPLSAFESKEPAPHFVDVAEKAGLRLKSMAGGVIVDDFENNGLLDVVTSSMNMCEHLHYFHNNGDGTFSDRSEKAGLADQLGGLNMIQADYNNDGCMDILVLRGGWEIPMRKSLLRGNCNGTFTDVTKQAGLSDPPTATQSAVWADINNDGWLDLFVAAEHGPAQLFLNNGNGTFKNIAHTAGVDQTAFSKSVVSADYDNDGYPDFYVSVYGGNNFLYHNNHNNTFSEVASQAGVVGPHYTFPSWFFDYDNDGWPDLLVNSYFISVDESIRTISNLPHNALTTKLYHNERDGSFKDVTSDVRLDKVYMPMGANFGDIDNDGFLDIYIGNGYPNYAALIPHFLFRNHDGKYFSDVTAATGTGELHKGHAVAFADLARDGNEDILTVTGGATPGDAHAFRLFENPGNGNDWLNLKLVGSKSNRAAVGTRIKVTVENQGKTPHSIYRTVGSGGSFGASPLEQHIGLGKSAQILSLEIWWPTSNTRQNFTGVATRQFLQINELQPKCIKLERNEVKLGGRQPTTAEIKK
jgi:tetratricopeptide (TPR) repeat protein